MFQMPLKDDSTNAAGKPFKRNKSLNVNMQMMEFIKLTPKILWYSLYSKLSATINSPTLGIQFFRIFMPLFTIFFFSSFWHTRFLFSWRLSTFSLTFFIIIGKNAHVKKSRSKSSTFFFVSIKELYCKYKNSGFNVAATVDENLQPSWCEYSIWWTKNK